jgi:L-lactate dehydrogenase
MNNTTVREQPRVNRVAVIGMGQGDSTFAYALLLSGLAEEIVLINRTKEKAEGEAMDLNHAAPFAHATKIWAGDYQDCARANITVITAGAAQDPGKTRLDLMKKNASIFKKIVPRVMEYFGAACQPGHRFRHHPGYLPVSLSPRPTFWRGPS